MAYDGVREIGIADAFEPRAIELLACAEELEDVRRRPARPEALDDALRQ